MFFISESRNIQFVKLDKIYHLNLICEKFSYYCHDNYYSLYNSKLYKTKFESFRILEFIFFLRINN